MITGRKIYGVDPSKKVTPVMVRDAIIRCFLRAHEAVLEEMKEYADFKSEGEMERLKKKSVEMLVRKFFEETGGDFENPTKDDLIRVCDKLAEFAANFRKPEIIKRHYGEIMKLIERLE